MMDSIYPTLTLMTDSYIHTYFHLNETSCIEEIPATSPKDQGHCLRSHIVSFMNSYMNMCSYYKGPFILERIIK